MEPLEALNRISAILNMVTMIAKPNGVESGLTQIDRIEIGQCASILRGALSDQAQATNTNGKQEKAKAKSS